MKAVWEGRVIAESNDTLVVEGNHYFPADSVNFDYLVPSSTVTTCSWKGTASYYSLNVGGRILEDAAWYYAHPRRDAAHIAGRIAFWRGVRIEE